MNLERELFQNVFRPEMDIYEDSVFVRNHLFPIGSFATETLNITDDTIAILNTHSTTIRSMSIPFQNRENKSLSLLLPALRDNIANLIRDLCQLPSCAPWDVNEEIRKLNVFFSDDALENVLGSEFLSPFFWKYIESATSISSAIQNFRDIGRFLEENFLRTVPRRDEQNFATATSNCFCSDRFLSLVYSQRFVADNFVYSPCLYSKCSFAYAPNDKSKLIFLDTIAFDNYMDFLIYDLLKGMHHGHAPSKCECCGKYFLTVDAHKPKYCNGMAPQNPHYTCRQYGAMNQQKEKNVNHPIFQIFKTRTGTIRKHHQRGKITNEERQEAMKVCEELRDRALFDTKFAQGEYIRLMEQDAVYSEVSKRFGGGPHDK